MASIEVSEKTYKRLLALKSDNESFDELLDRLTRDNNLEKLIGILPVTEVDKLEKFIVESREHRRKNYFETIEKMMDNDS